LAVVKVENGGRLAALPPFWCCEVRKWEKNRRE
jgi:hypothetical protein